MVLVLAHGVAVGPKLFSVIAGGCTATTTEAAAEHAPAAAVTLTLRPSAGHDLPVLVQAKVTVLPDGTAGFISAKRRWGRRGSTAHTWSSMVEQQESSTNMQAVGHIHVCS